MDVKIPEKYTNPSISTSPQSLLIGHTTEKGYNVKKVNTGNEKGNYTITVSYTTAGIVKTATYNVTKCDTLPPTISGCSQVYLDSSEGKSGYINNIVVNDSLSGINTVKYESENISLESAPRYFANYGKNLVDGVIQIEKGKKHYTIYAEDNAGNIVIVVITLTSPF